MERLAALLNQGRDKGLVDHESCLLLLGQEFKKGEEGKSLIALRKLCLQKKIIGSALSWLSSSLSLREVGQYFLENFILVHIKDGHERMLMLAHMARKLFALVCWENISPSFLVLTLDTRIGSWACASGQFGCVEHSRNLDFWTDLCNGFQREAVELDCFFCETGALLLFVSVSVYISLSLSLSFFFFFF